MFEVTEPGVSAVFRALPKHRASLEKGPKSPEVPCHRGMINRDWCAAPSHIRVKHMLRILDPPVTHNLACSKRAQQVCDSKTVRFIRRQHEDGIFPTDVGASDVL